MQISVERTDSNMSYIVGDIVNVVDWGRVYSTNVSWFEKNFEALNRDWIIRYAFGDSSNYLKFRNDPLDETKYKVLFIGKHNICNSLVALIAEDYAYSPVYLIGLDGLSRYIPPKKMTQKEIEKELGYKIEIVNDKE